MKESVIITIVGMLAGIFAPYYSSRFMCYIDSSYGACNDPMIIQWILGMFMLILLGFAVATFAGITYLVVDFLKKSI